MLYECHGHIILDGISYPAADALHKNGVNEAAVRQNLKICQDAGVTFYRDGGDRRGVSAFARQIAGEYSIDYRTPVYIIHKEGGYGRLFGRAFADMSTYRELVQTAKHLGADFIKITVSGMLDFARGGAVTGSALTLQELREMVNIASGDGFSVMAHVNGAVNIKNALEAGAASIEHGFHIDDDAIAMLRETGAVWVPTCSAVAGLIGSGRFDDGVLRTLLDRHCAALRDAYAQGALVASGSDAGAAGVPQGRGILDEYSILHNLGIDPGAGNGEIARLFSRH